MTEEAGRHRQFIDEVTDLLRADDYVLGLWLTGSWPQDCPVPAATRCASDGC